MSQSQELPLYLAMYKLQKYLYLIIKNFPKEYKYTLGQSILDKGHDTLDYIIQANRAPNISKGVAIMNAFISFDYLKTRLRMAFDLSHISYKRYAFINIQNEEIGKMLNGWKKWSRLR
jgi:hypothetical protein